MDTDTFKPDLLPSFTFPCDAQTALDLARQIQEKLRTDWQGVGGVKDGVDLGLAARIIESYHGIWKTKATPNLFTAWDEIPRGICLVRMFHERTKKHCLHLHCKLHDGPWNDQPEFPACYSEAASHGENQKFWEWAAINLPTWDYPTPVKGQ